MNKFRSILSIFSFSLIALFAVMAFPVTKAQASVTGPAMTLSSNIGGTITEVVLQATSDSLSASGQYTVNFEVTKGSSNTNPNPSILLGLEKDKCPEGNGQTKSQTVRYHMTSFMADGPYCFAPNESDSYTGISLTPGNNFVQDFSVTTTQAGNVPCGSFQTDIWVLEVGGTDHYLLNNSLDNFNPGFDKIRRFDQYVLNFGGKSYPEALAVDSGAVYTGKDLSTCLMSPSPSPMPSPSANPSPSPSVAPSPSPSAAPSPSPVPSPSPSVSPSPSPSPSPSANPSPSPSPSVAPSPSPSESPSPSPSESPSPSPSVSPSPSASPSPSISPSPSPSISPSPVPSASPTVVTCNDNETKQVNGSTIVCISLNQNQGQDQSQTNNNNQTNNNGVTVVSQAPISVTTLPKTGLPLAGLALGGLFPMGATLKKRFSKSISESANSIWTSKQFKA